MKLFSFALFALAPLCVLPVLTGCSGTSPSNGTSSPPAAVSLKVTSVAPTTVQAGASSFTLTVTGTGFDAATRLQVGGTDVPSTLVNSTQLTAAVPAKSVSNGALLSVVALNATTSTPADSTAVKLEVDNPVPQISGFSPTTFIAGSGSTTISVTGTGFVPSTVIQVNGSSRPTGFASSTQVNLTLTDADLAAGGALSLIAFNPAPAGGSSAAASVPVLNPVPGNISISPATVGAGTVNPTTVVVTGSNFVAGAMAQVNGSNRPTTIAGPTQLTFQLTVADQATQGKASITVANPAPGGGTSPAATLTLVPPTPTPVISSVTPTQLIVNSPGSLTVSGTNLNSTSVVNWNGTPLVSHYQTLVSGYTTYSYLSAAVPADLVASTGSASITVTNPTAITASNALTVQIVNPSVPTLTSISPGGTALATATTVTVTGTGFTPSSVVQFDGTALTTKYLNSASLSAQVSASLVTLPGTHMLTVSTPAPGGGVSGSSAFTAYIGLPNNAMTLNPVSGLLYVSVPGSAGAPYGNTVVSVDPATGILGTPIPVGSEPDKLAISSDGTTLWVGLDGASAVRKVDLTSGTAGAQFSLGGNKGIYAYPPVVHAIAVLPGTTNSVVISASSNPYIYQDALTIYDNGVMRANQTQLSTISTPPAIWVNPTKPEIYATSSDSGYQVFTYDSSGLKHVAGDNGTSVFNGNYGTAVQVDNGRAYLDTGKVLDAETGSLLGTFYTTGTTVATGPMVSDSSLGKNFILLGTGSYYNYSSTPVTPKIQAYLESDLTQVSSGALQVSGAVAGTKFGAGNSSATAVNGPNPIDTLVRWGSNGLAFRAANGIFSVRSNIVRDLSTTNADLQVALNAPATGTPGTTYTATATVTNNGPSTANAVAFAETLPANASVVSFKPSQGQCTAGATISCNLGNLNSGASVTVALVLQGTDAGNAALSANAVANENDPTPANNTATATTALSGGTYALVPTLTALSPNVAQAGATDLTLTVNGTGFVSGSKINWAGTALNTAFVNSTQLTATVSSTSLSKLGWAPVTVSSPAPGGGTSNTLGFTIYNNIKLAGNRIAVEPFSRVLYATVNSAATETTGNSLVTIDPVAGSLGTPISVGSQPGKMAFSDDGNVMYIAQQGGSSVGHFNLLTQTLDFSFPVTAQGSYSTSTLTVRDLAVAPGGENTVAVDLGAWPGTAIYDVDPANKTAKTRAGSYGQNTNGAYTGSSLQFLNSTTLFTVDGDTSGGTLDSWTLTPTGLSGYGTEYTLNSFGYFQLVRGTGYANAGGVADLTATPPAPLGVFLPPISNTGSNTYSYYSSTGQITAPDPTLGRSFFALIENKNNGNQLTFRAFDQKSYQMTNTISLPLPSSNSSSTTLTDIVRWGADGLAVLRSDGQITLIRGPFVMPGLLGQNGAATLTSVSSSTLAHGSGNVTLTITGSGFVPGAAVQWNGAYRTTTAVDATHLSVAIPASDLQSAGTASITVLNPGAAASNALTATIN